MHLCLYFTTGCCLQDGPIRLQSKDLTDNTGEVTAFVSSMRATGGGDAPEDVLGGLNCASSLNWTEGSARFLVLIADAPMHGKNKGYNDCGDTYPDGDPLGLTPESVIGKLHSQSISLIFTRINSLTDKMIKVFDTVLASSSAAAKAKAGAGAGAVEEAKVKVIEMGSTDAVSKFKESISSEVISRLMEHFL